MNIGSRYRKSETHSVRIKEKTRRAHRFKIRCARLVSEHVVIASLASLLLVLCLCFFPLLLPFCEFSLAFLAFVVGLDVRQQTASDAFNHMLGNACLVDQLFSAHSRLPLLIQFSSYSAGDGSALGFLLSCRIPLPIRERDCHRPVAYS